MKVNYKLVKKYLKCYDKKQMVVLIIYLVGAIVAIATSYYRVYFYASEGDYFKFPDLLMCIGIGILSWFGFILMALIVLDERGYKLWKIK